MKTKTAAESAKERAELMADERVFGAFLARYCGNCRWSGEKRTCEKAGHIRPDGWGNLACTCYTCAAIDWIP